MATMVAEPAFIDTNVLVYADQAASAFHVSLVRSVPIGGKQVHDANIVATMLAHGIPRLLTFIGADFRRFEPVIAVLPP